MFSLISVSRLIGYCIMQFENFISSFLQNILDNHGEGLRIYNAALQQQIQHVHFLAILVCKTENVKTVLEHHEVVQKDLDSGKVSWQDENYFRSWQASVLRVMKLTLGDGEVYNNVKEEFKDSFIPDTTDAEDPVCIKFKIEKPSRGPFGPKPGTKRKENVTLKTLRERERKILTCDSCENFITKSSKKMDRHLFEVHERTMCHDCGMHFESFDEFFNHSFDHKESFVCNKCGAEFKEQRYFRNHVSRMHPELREISGQSLIVCQQCGKAYSSKESLKLHIKYQHEKNFVPLLCSYLDCSFTAKQESDIRRHIASVHEKSLEKCQWCGKFVKNIKQHLRINQCNIPEEERVKTIGKNECLICHKMVSKINFRKHMNKMHGEGNQRTFHCERCSYKTNVKYNLKLHVSKVHDRDYVKKMCPHCTKEVVDLYYHMKTYHYDHMTRN